MNETLVQARLRALQETRVTDDAVRPFTRLALSLADTTLIDTWKRFEIPGTGLLVLSGGSATAYIAFQRADSEVGRSVNLITGAYYFLPFTQFYINVASGQSGTLELIIMHRGTMNVLRNIAINSDGTVATYASDATMQDVRALLGMTSASPTNATDNLTGRRFLELIRDNLGSSTAALTDAANTLTLRRLVELLYLIRFDQSPAGQVAFQVANRRRSFTSAYTNVALGAGAAYSGSSTHLTITTDGTIAVANQQSLSFVDAHAGFYIDQNGTVRINGRTGGSITERVVNTQGTTLGSNFQQQAFTSISVFNTTYWQYVNGGTAQTTFEFEGIFVS